MSQNEIEQDQLWINKIIESENQFLIATIIFLASSMACFCFLLQVATDINIFHFILISLVCIVIVALLKQKVSYQQNNNFKQRLIYLFGVFILASMVFGGLFYIEKDINSQIYCNYIIQHSQPVSGKMIAYQLKTFNFNNSCSNLEDMDSKECIQLIQLLSIQTIRRLCRQHENSQTCQQLNELSVYSLPKAYHILKYLQIIGVLNLLLIIPILKQVCQQNHKKESTILEKKQYKLPNTDQEQQQTEFELFENKQMNESQTFTIQIDKRDQ
ncbi:hypothetical protein ABPG74_021205 [Tetrahymena malaccensis]